MINKENPYSDLSLYTAKMAQSNQAGNFDDAVFAEPSTSLRSNYEQFLSQARVTQILPGRSISVDFAEFAPYHEVALVVAESKHMNFLRWHLWPHLRRRSKPGAREDRFIVNPSVEAGVGCLDIKQVFGTNQLRFIKWQLAKAPNCRLRLSVIRSSRTLSCTKYGLRS